MLGVMSLSRTSVWPMCSMIQGRPDLHTDPSSGCFPTGHNPFAGYHLYCPSRRQQSPAFAVFGRSPPISCEVRKPSVGHAFAWFGGLSVCQQRRSASWGRLHRPCSRGRGAAARSLSDPCLRRKPRSHLHGRADTAPAEGCLSPRSTVSTSTRCDRTKDDGRLSFLRLK